MQSIKLLFSLVICSGFLMACQSLTPPAETDSSLVKAKSAEFFEQLVQEKYVEPFRSGDVQAWISVFTEDAIALHNHRPADKGRDAIEAFVTSVHQYFNLAEYDVRVTDVRMSENWVYTVGEYTNEFVNKSDGKSPWGRSEGKFVLLWEKQGSGQWQIVLDMGNSNLQ